MKNSQKQMSYNPDLSYNFLDRQITQYIAGKEENMKKSQVSHALNAKTISRNV